MARKTRRTRPTVEGLEDRQLLDSSPHSLLGPDGKPISAQNYARLQVQYVNALNGSHWYNRKFAFRTPTGGRGLIVLYGLGTLKGTSYDPVAGVLDLVYNNTSSSSKIIGFVRGGNGLAKIRTMRDADVPLNSNSGVGTNVVDVVNLHSFDLVAGGQINLAGGVGSLFLHSAAPNTLINLRSLPIQVGQVAPPSSVLGVQFVGTTGGGQELAGIGGLTVPGAGGSTEAGPSASGFTTRINPDGTVSLIPVTGTTTTQVLPFGINLVIDQVNGTPREVPLANPQIFGYDSTLNALIRFDARTGANLGSIPLTIPGAAVGEAAVVRDQGRLVVAAGVGTNVEVFDAVDGTYVGQFSTTNILNGDPIDGVGRAERGSLTLTSSAANEAQIVDVEASLATGQAVPATTNTGSPSPPFTPSRQFTLTGGATGAAGLNSDFLGGQAFFDSFQPTTPQPGILTVNTVNDKLAETARTSVPSATSPAVGSVDFFVAINEYDTTTQVNTMTLYDPSSFSTSGSIVLQDSNPITGLSESFNPELEGAVVINALGTVNQFTARNATGLVFDTIGYLNLMQMGTATDSAFVGEPIGHVNIAVRNNVSIYSTNDREVKTRGGVILVPGLRAIGPFNLPGPPLP